MRPEPLRERLELVPRLKRALLGAPPLRVAIEHPPYDSSGEHPPKRLRRVASKRVLDSPLRRQPGGTVIRQAEISTGSSSSRW
jgi:hypothetical protein